MLILRAWVERDGGLRVRISAVVDRAEMPVEAATTADAVCRVVRHWLRTVPGQAPPS